MTSIVNESTDLFSIQDATRKLSWTTLQHTNCVKTFQTFRRDHGSKEATKVESELPKYKHVCSAQISGFFERFRRVVMPSGLVLISVSREPRTQ